MRVAAAASEPGADSITVTTDARGMAPFALTFGSVPGRAIVRFRSASGFADSTVFDLPEGTATSIDVVPVDPPYAGDITAIVWRAYDAGSRPVYASAILEVVDTSIAIFVDASHVVAKTTGFTWVRGSVGGARDSVPLAVVPQGRLAALAFDVWTHFDLNGGSRTAAFTPAGAFNDPRSSPSGDTLAYSNGRVKLLIPGPNVVSVVPAVLGFVSERHPVWSTDGQWIYFTAAYPDGRSEIWRIRPDGAGAVRVGPAAAAGETDFMPSVSPSGTLLAFTTNRALAGAQATLRIVNLSTGATVISGVPGASARFSPDGTRLAFLAGGQMMMVNADGTNLRTLTPALTAYSGQLSWSPDGRWIAVAHGGSQSIPLYLHLVDTATDTAIRLPYAFAWINPEWQ